MHSAPGVTMGLNWGSSGSAIKVVSTPISMQVHKTPPLSPDHCYDRPKRLQSIVSMCIQGVLNARIIGELPHKSPAGAVAACGGDVHPGTPPCLAHLQRTVRMPTPGALTRQPVRAKEQCTPKILMRELLQCIHSSHSSEWHVSEFSVRKISPKRHKTLLEAQLRTRTIGPWNCGTTVVGMWVFRHREQKENSQFMQSKPLLLSVVKVFDVIPITS